VRLLVAVKVEKRLVSGPDRACSGKRCSSKAMSSLKSSLRIQSLREGGMIGVCR
jgi:hypothetical protein